MARLRESDFYLTVSPGPFGKSSGRERKGAQMGRVSRLGRGEADGLNTVNLLIAERVYGCLLFCGLKSPKMKSWE